jgi:glycosyltransferase involved in cell wall biosynthesis
MQSIPTKRVLLVNNYDMALSRESYLKKESPEHHQFGTSLLIEKGYQVDYELVAPKRYNSKIKRLISLIPKWFKLYRKARKYDYVYGAADFTIDFLGMLKKIGMFKPKLITIMHHPPFPIRLQLATYDRIIFLSEFAYVEMSKKFKKMTPKMEFIQWGPDLDFYDQIITEPNYLRTDDEVSFISNGKTHRDHEIFVSAAENSKCHSIIVSARKDIPRNYTNQCVYTEIFIQEHPNDIQMVKLLNKCSVLVVPTYPTEGRLGPIGLTSFLDAVALGMPIITASNTILTDIISKKELGFVYKAGDMADLQDKMLSFKENPELIKECGKNAYDFREECNIFLFSSRIYQIILELEK